MPSGTIFNHETVVLDGEAFADCEFRDCRLIYSGGETPSFKNCKFDACDWRMDDAAARTLAYLKVVWNAGQKAKIQSIIKDVTVVAR